MTAELITLERKLKLLRLIVYVAASAGLLTGIVGISLAVINHRWGMVLVNIMSMVACGLSVYSVRLWNR